MRAPTHLGLEGDLLDALVLGPRLAFGTRLRVNASGAITLTDRGMSDDKLVCSAQPLSHAERLSAALLPLPCKVQATAQHLAAPVRPQCL